MHWDGWMDGWTDRDELITWIKDVWQLDQRLFFWFLHQTFRWIIGLISHHHLMSDITHKCKKSGFRACKNGSVEGSLTALGRQPSVILIASQPKPWFFLRMLRSQGLSGPNLWKVAEATQVLQTVIRLTGLMGHDQGKWTTAIECCPWQTCETGIHATPTSLIFRKVWQCRWETVSGLAAQTLIMSDISFCHPCETITYELHPRAHNREIPRNINSISSSENFHVENHLSGLILNINHHDLICFLYIVYA